jgi:zinc protease
MIGRNYSSANHSTRKKTWMLRSSALAFVCAGLTLPAFAQNAPATPEKQQSAEAQTTGIPAWGLTSSDLPADPSVRFGVLPNGMRYALKRNVTPKGAAVIRFAFDVGMREAEPEQGGAAHFLEHMAFNGSTNIPEGELVKRLERLGLAFGADTNAETGLEQTTYKLDLPNTNPETVDSALNFMREIASELTLNKDAVDRERGILLSEFRVRDVPQSRRALDALGKQMRDPRFGPAMVGTPQTIANITPEQLRAFYEGYYRPDRATLVMVGDFDVAAMERDIRTRFANWQGKGTAKDNYVPVITPTTSPIIATFTDPSVPEIIQFDRVVPYMAPKNNVVENRRDLLQAIAGAALSNRLSVIGRASDSPIIFGQAAVQDLARSARTATMIVVAKDGQWLAALGVGEQQLRKAIAFGFTAAEIAEAKANIRNLLENAVKQEAGAPSAAIADQIASASLSDSIYLAPSANLALYNALDPSLTAEAVSEAFRAAWAGGPSLVHVATKQTIAGGDTAVASALATSAKIAVAAPVDAATKAFAYDNFGPAGKILSDTIIADLGIRTIRFANGVELNLKKTDFEPGKIAWLAKIGDGGQMFPSDKQGLPVLVQILTSIDGFKKHNVDELRRITAGRQVAIGMSVTDDGLAARGSTTASDLALQLKLLAAGVTDPAYDPATQAQWAGIAPVISKNIMSNPSQVAALAVPYILTGDDARFGIGDGDQLAVRTLDEMKAVIAPQLANGVIRLGLVGDIDENAAITAVAESLGALPNRTANPASPVTVKPVTFTANRALRTLYHAGSADQGAIALTWPTTDDSDFKATIARNLLAEVMGLRLIDVLREQLGATYTPNARSEDSTTYKGFGYLTASAPAAQSAMDIVAKAIVQIATDLRSTPPSADELLRARKPVLERWQRQERQNGSWVGLVAEAQQESTALDWRRTRTAILEAIVASDITAQAKLYLDPAAAVETRIVPKPAAGG